MVSAQFYLAEQLSTFRDFSLRQEPTKLDVEAVMNNLKNMKGAD